jgi:hypothetical protein
VGNGNEEMQKKMQRKESKKKIMQEKNRSKRTILCAREDERSEAEHNTVI